VLSSIAQFTTQLDTGFLFMQVAINWTICKGALPIPGAKNARQAKEAAGATAELFVTSRQRKFKP
jgi:aryl-alcohol dehydrogenase-like predicted oxidoreductase